MAKPVKVIFTLLLLNFCINADAQTNNNQTPTDQITRQVVEFMNAGKPDSVYEFAGKEMKKQLSKQLWTSLYRTTFTQILPFNDVVFISTADSVSKYKLQGKASLALYIGLDKENLLKTFLFKPWEEVVKSALMTSGEEKTDVLAKKILGLMDRKQADSIYLHAAESFRNKLDARVFKEISENDLFPLGPFSKAVFVDSKNGVNRYKFRNFQFLIDRDKDGKFSTLLIQPFRQPVKLTVHSVSDNPMKTQLDTLANKHLSAYIRTSGIIGLSAAVHFKGKDYYYNYGETKKGNAQLPNNQTIYDIGSITKTFTSTLLAIAVVEGKVTLNTPITTFLPDSVASNPNLKGITFKHLANHTSGLPRLAGNHSRVQSDINQPYANYGAQHLFSYLKRYRALRKPEAKYEYSNLATGLLGVLLEKIYKEPYKNLVQKYITAPAKMSGTVFTVKLNDPRYAQGYNEQNIAVPAWTFKAMESAGAIKSSSFDLLKYGRLQLNSTPSLLTSANTLTHKVTYKSAAEIVGLNWHFLPASPNIMFHNGATGGFTSCLAINSEKNIVVAILTNNRSNGDAVALQLMKTLQVVR